MGYEWDSPCYRVYFPDTGEIVSSDNVVFQEGKIESRSETEVEHTRREREEPELTDDESEDDEQEEPDKEERQQDRSNEKDDKSDRKAQDIQPGRSLRDRSRINPHPKFVDYVMDYMKGGNIAQCAMIGEVQEISTKEALQDPNWRKAMQEEYDSLMKMQTWRMEKCPKDMKPLTCKWVLREKADGRLKARLVARGLEQREGLDYAETFSPVARHASIRLILSHAASKKMKIVTFDVKTAFLYGKLYKVLYMKQPEGFEDGSDNDCRLQKAIYGLKQAPKCWNKEATNCFEEMGLTSTDDDPCVFYNKDRSILMSLFVDDGLIAGTNEREIFKLLKQISKEFEITYPKTIQDDITYLGMELKVREDGIFVSQPRYTEKMLKKMRHDDSNPVSTPMDVGLAKEMMENSNDKTAAINIPYREAIGSLLYLSTISRPDISFAVNFLSRFCASPTDVHWSMVKRIFKYLRGTTKAGIFFNGDTKLEAYSDSDFGGDKETRMSTTGVLLMRGGPLVWYSQKQRLVATSTAEAEYRAAVAAIDDICWVRRIAAELNMMKEDEPTTLYIDNRSAVHMLQNAHEGKTFKGKKHIEISRKFIQQNIGKTVNPQPVRSDQQLADILTKPLCKKTFVNLRSELIQEEC